MEHVNHTARSLPHGILPNQPALPKLSPPGTKKR